MIFYSTIFGIMFWPTKERQLARKQRKEELKSQPLRKSIGADWWSAKPKARRSTPDEIQAKLDEIDRQVKEIDARKAAGHPRCPEVIQEELDQINRKIEKLQSLSTGQQASNGIRKWFRRS
ncbi:hypothetical protein KQ306_03315 [Synechococcus sp. CS-1324]|uniref:hypothetical protein n=1 Tax=Synechococcus sp. CS-1324 TaxID=2847980 RepID=UPI00223A8758|nr:hypothetical protein [Synechococcus sp. CS-1324]MCT0229893.1 hypothetical protein [Synechococcus sp. CS-1324]